MDRLLVTLTALLLALTSLGAAAAGTAAPEPGPPLDGEEVSGSRDADDAPELTTGTWIDELPRSGRLHYRLPRHQEGSTFHVAVMAVGVGDSVGEGLRLAVGTTPGGRGCGSGGVFRPTLGEQDPVLFASASTWTDVPDHACATATELHLAVHAPSDPADAGRRFEILVYEEPALTAWAYDLLPEPDRPTWSDLQPAERAREVTPGSTPANAPVVADGSFALTLRPGRTLVLAVPLDWGQSLQAQLDGQDPDSASDGLAEQVQVDIVGPLLGSSQVPLADRVPGAQTQAVSYRNRDSYDATINTEALAGLHYVLVRWVSEKPGDDLPMVLTLKTSDGSPESTPEYLATDALLTPAADSALADAGAESGARGDTASGTASDHERDADPTDDLPLTPVILAGGAALIVLLVGLARRRRRRHAGGRHRD